MIYDTAPQAPPRRRAGMRGSMPAGLRRIIIAGGRPNLRGIGDVDWHAQCTGTPPLPMECFSSGGANLTQAITYSRMAEQDNANIQNSYQVAVDNWKLNDGRRWVNGVWTQTDEPPPPPPQMLTDVNAIVAAMNAGEAWNPTTQALPYYAGGGLTTVTQPNQYLVAGSGSVYNYGTPATLPATAEAWATAPAKVLSTSEWLAEQDRIMAERRRTAAAAQAAATPPPQAAATPPPQAAATAPPQAAAPATNYDATMQIRIENLTSPGATIHHTGEQWRLVITGAPPNAQIRSTALQNGQGRGAGINQGRTDANGNFTQTGTFEREHAGTWQQSWTVGPPGLAGIPRPRRLSLGVLGDVTREISFEVIGAQTTAPPGTTTVTLPPAGSTVNLPPVVINTTNVPPPTSSGSGGGITSANLSSQLQQPTSQLLPSAVSGAMPAWLKDLPVWQTGVAAGVVVYAFNARKKGRR